MQLRHLLTSLLMVFSLWAQTVMAALVVSEVAWMGGVSSPNHEWIELYNTGNEVVNVHEWTLTDGFNLAITLTGTIAPGVYAVLERTSEDSAPGAAFLVYTGALVNTGATLTLRRSDGQIEDQIVGGENWQNIGGDNISKATAQYTGSDWITAAPTPGAVNAKTGSAVVEGDTLSPVVPNDRAAGGGGRTSTAGRASTVPLTPAKTTLALGIEGQRTAFVNQKISFAATPSGVGDTISDSLKYQWNFGDFTTASGSKVAHAYAYPGTYIVTARAQYARHNTLARHEIIVLPTALTITYAATGELQLQNNASYDVDVSGFTVRVGAETMVFPQDSLIMAKQVVILKVPSRGRDLATLRDGAGMVVASTKAFDEQMPMQKLLSGATGVGQSVAPTPAVLTTRAPDTSVVQSVADNEDFGFHTAVLPLPPDTSEATVASRPLQEEATLVSASETKATPRPPVWWPYLVLLGVLVLALLAVFYARAQDPEPNHR